MEMAYWPTIIPCGNVLVMMELHDDSTTEGVIKMSTKILY